MHEERKKGVQQWVGRTDLVVGASGATSHKSKNEAEGREDLRVY